MKKKGDQKLKIEDVNNNNQEKPQENTLEKNGDQKAEEVNNNNNQEKPQENEKEKVPKELTDQDLDNMSKQLDFYFSDSNYPKDKFILDLANADGGWVPVEVFLKFNKIKKWTGDVNVVEKCFRKCKLVEVSEDGKKVKRLGAFMDPVTLESKTVCASGFSSGKYVNKIEVEKAFTVFGKVMSVWHIKDRINKKKRSVFVEFASEDIAKKAIEAGTLNYMDAGKEYPIAIVSKKVYNEQVAENEKNYEKKNKNKRKRDDGDIPNLVFSPGLLLKILTDPKEIILAEEKQMETIKFLKQAFAQYGKIGYVDLKGIICIIRFHEAQSTQNALKALVQDKTKIRDKELNAVIMDGEEEKKYWEENIINRQEKK